MANKTLLFENEARETLIKGIEKLAKAVTSTLGPKGNNVALDRPWGPPAVVHDGVSVCRDIDLNDNFENMGAKLVKQAAVQTGENVGDGPQPLDCKILTPKGWTTMGEIKVGDRVCGTDGSIQKVTGIFPKGVKQIFKIKIHGGRETRCCKDHLWSVTTNNGLDKTLTTNQLIKNGIIEITKNGDKKHNFYIPITKVDFRKHKFNLDPYLIGVLIGDGSLTGSGDVELSLGLNKEHIFNKLILPEGIRLKTTFIPSKNYFRSKIIGKTKDGKTIKDLLMEIDLFGTNSSNKFIPKKYLYSDFDSRVKLLEGLSDTDGHINNRGLLEYSTISKQLYFDVIELLRSLGKDTFSYLKDKSKDNGSYSNTPIYRISELKGCKYGLYIEDIVPTDEYVEMQCIKVSNPDNLYITDDYICTHNTTSSVLLAYKLTKNGNELIKKGYNAMGIRKGMEKAATDVLKMIEDESTPIKSKDDLIRISTISAGDDEIGQTIANALERVGQDGLVTVEDGQTTEIETEFKEGMQFDQGFISIAFVNRGNYMDCIMEDVDVLLVSKKLSNINDISGLDDYFKTGRKLLIIASEIDGQALETLVMTRVKAGVPICIVRAPGFGDNQQQMLEDMAYLTGGIVISPESGRGLDRISPDLSEFGHADKIHVTRDFCRIVGGKGSNEAINDRISQLKELIKNTNSDYDKSKLTERLAKLTGGAAIIKIGALSESEMIEKRERAIDAVEATKAAIDEGIVPGGGVTLYQIYKTLEIPKNLSKEELAGYTLVKESLKEPIIKLLTNAGENVDEKINLLNSKNEPGFGFDINTGELVNMVDNGIIDPTKVTKTAFKNAVSVASSVLTTCCLVTDIKEDKGGDDPIYG